MFRGQSRHYVPLLPSGRRRRLPGNDIWRHYSRRLIQSDFPLQSISIPAGGDVTPLVAESKVRFLWLAAVAQHYGPGSDYIDVTHDLAIAVWFALHEPVFWRHEMALGPVGADSPPDEIVRSEWVGFQNCTQPASLYVFDVPEWPGEKLPKPGVLVDLAHAPRPFSDSTRMKAQSACLLRAGDIDDMLRFAVTSEPIQLASDMAGVPARTVEDLFPPPEADPWYATFLALPLIDRPPTRDETRPFLSPPVPVTLYVSGGTDSTFVRDISRRLRPLTPARVGVSTVQHFLANGQIQSASDITLVCVQAPQMSNFMAPDTDDYWNHELLMNDISARIPAGKAGGIATSDISLTRVLFEWSPLESIVWRDLYGDAESRFLVRAVLIDRSGPDVHAMLLAQNYPDSDAMTLTDCTIRFDAASRRIQLRLPDDPAQWHDLATYGEAAAKPIFVALALLRELSPSIKTPARKPFTSGGPPVWDYLLPVTAASAYLHEVKQEDAFSWYFLRDDRGEPYTEAGRAIGFMTLRTIHSYPDLPAETIRLAVTANYDRIVESSTPVVVELA